MMARSRNIKPGFFANEHLASLPFETRLLFIGLWTLADREGRLEDRPVKIKMQLFAADSIDVDTCLEQLARAGEPFIERYVVDGVAVIQVVNFTSHQAPHRNETSSVLPPRGEEMNDQGAKDFAPRSEVIDDHSAKRGKEGISNQESGIGDQQSGISNQESGIGVLELFDSKTTPDHVFSYFAKSSAAKKPRDLTEGRRKRLVSRLRVPNWPWKEAIDKLPIPNDPKFQWQPTFDWLIENDEHARKLADGDYDRIGGNVQTQNNLSAVDEWANG